MKRLLGLAAVGFTLTLTTHVGAATVQQVPLTASTTTNELVTVVADFGNLGKPHERFADVLGGEGKRYAVITPEGMATNGGISVASLGGVRHAALLPSQLLTFTPLATSKALSTWTPGVVDVGVARHPDAITALGSTTLVVDRRGAVHQSTDLEHWTPVKVALPPWARAARCKPVAVVASVKATSPTFGLSCAKPTRSVVMTGAMTQPTGAVLSRQLLRLHATASGFMAIEWVPKLRRVVIEQFSPDLVLRSTAAVALGQVQATAVNDAGKAVLLGRNRHATKVVVVQPSGATTSWRAPQRARAVAFTTSGQLQVLSVIDHVKRQEASLVTVRTLVGAKWTITERFGVPVPYGSSK